MVNRYRKLIDEIKQEPDSLKKIHDEVNSYLEQSDSFVQIDNSTSKDDIKVISIKKTKTNTYYLSIIKTAATLIIAVFTIGLILNRIINPLPADYNNPKVTSTPTSNPILYPDIEGVTLTKDGVDELFEEGGPLYNTEYTAVDCYNITKDEIQDKTGAVILVYKESGKAICVYNNEVIVLSQSNGFCDTGDSVSDIELTDLDNNGEYELIYSIIWHGSGLSNHAVNILDLGTKKISNLCRTVLETTLLKKINDELVLIYSNHRDIGNIVYANEEFGFIVVPIEANVSIENPERTAKPEHILWEVTTDINHDSIKEHIIFGYQNNLFTLECIEYKTTCVFNKENSETFLDNASQTNLLIEDLNNDGIDEIIIIGYKLNFLVCSINNGELKEIELPKYTDKYEVKESSPGQYELICTLDGWSTQLNNLRDEYKTTFTDVKCGIIGYKVSILNDKKVFVLTNSILIQGTKDNVSGTHEIYLSYDGNEVKIDKQELRLYSLFISEENVN